jgi:hypothetical protein
VPQFLSDEWIEMLGRTAAASPDLVLAGDDELVVEHVVTDLPDGTRAVFHVRLSAAAPEVQRGPAHEPTVRFTQRYPTAVGIATGSISAQAAFMSGELQIGGKVDELIARHGALVGIADVFGALRADTQH